MSVKHRLGKLENSDEMQIQAHVSAIKATYQDYVIKVTSLLVSWHDEIRALIADERPHLLADFDRGNETAEITEFNVSLIQACADGKRPVLKDNSAYRAYMQALQDARAVPRDIRSQVDEMIYDKVVSAIESWVQTL